MLPPVSDGDGDGLGDGDGDGLGDGDGDGDGHGDGLGLGEGLVLGLAEAFADRGQLEARFADREQLAEGLGDAPRLPELWVGMGWPLPFSLCPCPWLCELWAGLPKTFPTCEIIPLGTPVRAKLPTTTTATTAAMARAGLSHA